MSASEIKEQFQIAKEGLKAIRDKNSTARQAAEQGNQAIINEINEINQKTGQEPLVSLVSQVSLVSSLSSLSYIEQKHVDIIPEDFSDTTFDNVDIKQKYSALTMKNVNNLMEYYLAADMISEAGQGRFIFR